jgi:hypothetical protein
MNKKTLKTIVEHKKQLIPHVVTSRQVTLIEQYLNKKALTKTEQAYLYSTIKKKADALNLFREELYITGKDMIPERVEEAKQILKEINKEKAFISGSFLYSKKYNDIDIYIISNKRKQYSKGKRHLIYITEEDLKKSFFISAAKYSVSNTSLKISPEIKREEFSEILFVYQWVINQILDKEDQKELRILVFQYYMQIKEVILDSYTLFQKTEELKNLPEKEEIKKVNQITKELLLKTYSRTYLYNGISKFSKDFREIRKEYDTSNIPIFLNFAQEVKNECRRAKV